MGDGQSRINRAAEIATIPRRETRIDGQTTIIDYEQAQRGGACLTGRRCQGPVASVQGPDAEILDSGAVWSRVSASTRHPNVLHALSDRPDLFRQAESG